MGFFSWNTADTKESIANTYSGRDTKPVFLLQPNGQPPIKEEDYEGYGVFGGVDAYEWLAKVNAKPLGIDITGASPDELRIMGINLAMGHVLKDAETGDYWHVGKELSLITPSKHFDGDYSQVIPELGMSPNELIDSHRFVRVPFKSLLGLPFTLKFSHNENAEYELLVESESCGYQGFFYD